MNNLVFQKADIAKQNITDSAKKEIVELYSNWAKEIEKKADFYKMQQNASSWLQEQNMRQLQSQLEETSKQISNEIYGIVENSIYEVADSVVQANNDWLKGLGFPVTGVESAFVSVPDQTVRRLVTGQIYDTGWSLSKSIWGDNEDTLKRLYEIVGQGLAQNMTAYDISKMLEQYVSPNRAKPWNLQMPDGKRIYKKQVDYNAQRLVRTLTQHGYQTSFIAVTEKNPFVIDVIWRANGSRVCELCIDRDGQHFPKDDLPLDHPNGMCTMEPNIDSNMTDKLADWINSSDGTYPEIDAFASEFGYVPEIKSSVESINKSDIHNVVNGKDISATWERRPEQFDFEIEDVINAQGFDGLPRIVSPEEFDKLVKEANAGEGFIAQRSYSAPNQEILDAYREQLYNGKWYVDCSTGGAQYGQGMYCAADYTGTLTDGINTEMRHYCALQDDRLRYSQSQAIIDAQYRYAEEQRQKILDSINGEKELAMLRREFLYNGTADDRKLLKSLSDDEYDKMYDKLALIKEKADKAYRDATNLSKEEIASMFNIPEHAPNYVETFTLDPSARIITYEDVYNMQQSEGNAGDFYLERICNANLNDDEKALAIYYNQRELWNAGSLKESEYEYIEKMLEHYDKIQEMDVDKASEIEDTFWRKWGNFRDIDKELREYQKERQQYREMDVGAYAALRGYDAINAEGHGKSGSYTVILNRTKLIIKGG